MFLSWPNTLTVVSEILDMTDATYQRLSRHPPQLMVFLNDLPGNDFNTIFRSLHDFHEKLGKENSRSEFGACFVFGAPGSFHKRLFPSKLLHFVHSANSLHWISQVPKGLVDEDGFALNKGSIRVRAISPPEGLIEEKRFDAFNLPFYPPSGEEVAELVEIEGSFTVYKLGYLTTDLEDDLKMKDKEPKVIFWNNAVRSVLEPILASEFGEAMMDDLFQRSQDIGSKQSNMNVYRTTSLAISLTKK